MINIELIADEDIIKDSDKNIKNIKNISNNKNIMNISKFEQIKVPKLMQEYLDSHLSKTLEMFRGHPGLTRKERGMKEQGIQDYLYKVIDDSIYNAESKIIKY